MDPSDVTTAVDIVDEDHVGHRRELVKEGATMALYVAVCLLAALAVADEADVDHRPTILTVVWGTTLGLALAHWFAFRLSARLVAGGAVRRSDAELALAQFAGAVLVALVASVPVVVFADADTELAVTVWVVLGFIALVGLAVARSSGASLLRSVVYATGVAVLATTVVIVKNVLTGH